MAYFESIKRDMPEKFDDVEMTPRSLDENYRLEITESEKYESLCREPQPYVSVWVCVE